MREALISRQGAPQFTAISSLDATQLSVNWKRNLADLIDGDAESQDIILSPDFIQHATNLYNWTLPGEVLALFPMLEGIVEETQAEELCSGCSEPIATSYSQ